MKFSVLLPTRNGGRFLHNCIASVLDQPYADMELVVSDNANTDETADVLRSFESDPRLRWIRLDEPVPVTENWRTALEASRGDYVLLIGDDDCLLPGYFERMAQVLDRYDQPDCVGYGAHYFVFPDAIGNPFSYSVDYLFDFDPKLREGFVPPQTRHGIVRDLFRFRFRHHLGAQQMLIARRAADRIEGGMFRPPFPDFYAVSALLLRAKSVVYLPEKPLVVGVSPKSFHQFLLKEQLGEGMSYLGVDVDFAGRLPGNEMFNAIYVWLEQLRRDYPVQLGNVSINRAAYVRRQVFAWFLQLRSGALSPRSFLARCRRLSPGDWMGLALSPFDRSTQVRLLASFKRGRRDVDPMQSMWPAAQRLDGIRDIRQFAATVASPQ